MFLITWSTQLGTRLVTRDNPACLPTLPQPVHLDFRCELFLKFIVFSYIYFTKFNILSGIQSIFNAIQMLLFTELKAFTLSI